MPLTTSSTLPPSGEQHEIGYGHQRAIVSEVGATLREYSVNDSPVVDGFAREEMCSDGRGQVLAPWPNRLGDGSYSAYGRSAQAALDEPRTRCAIHGLVRWRPWRLVYRAQNVLVLVCTLDPQPGYPWRVEFTIEYRLGRGGLAVSMHVLNSDDHPAPLGVGFHPYLIAGTAMVDDALLQLPARRRLSSDERGLPNGEESVVGTPLDFTQPRLIGSIKLDTAYTDLVADDDGRFRAHLLEPKGTAGATVWMDEAFRYLMVYTGDTVGPAQRRRRALAIEPMTCPPDALRSGVGILRVEPGATWHSTWGITPRAVVT